MVLTPFSYADMEIFRITRNAWGQETLEGMSWDLLPVAFGARAGDHRGSPGVARAARKAARAGTVPSFVVSSQVPVAPPPRREGTVPDHAPRAHRPRVPLGDRAGGAAAAGQRLPAHPGPEVLLGAAALDHGRGADGRRAVSPVRASFFQRLRCMLDLAAHFANRAGRATRGQVHAGAEAHARRARVPRCWWRR